MVRRVIPFVSIALLVLTATIVTPPAAGEDLGRMRIQHMDGRWIVGEVEKLDNGVFKVNDPRGITWTLREHEIRQMVPAAAPAEGSENVAEEADPIGEYGVTRDEIDALTTGIDLNVEEVLRLHIDPLAELPVDEGSVAEMVRMAGTDEENVIQTPHVVMVYTGERGEALRLASRLEAVWRWNVRFLEMMDVPFQMPESKFEVYFFDSHDEFVTHQINAMGQTMPGALGYWAFRTNRSHFFDLTKYPPAAQRLERAENTNLSIEERRRHRTIVARWVEYMNMSVTQHEIGHHIHFNIGLFPRDAAMDRQSGSSVPRWLIEGTTMQFEVPPTSAGGSFGSVNHEQLRAFRQQQEAGRKFTGQSLKHWMLDDREWFMGGSAYPVGWALVYYMRLEHTDGYAKYLRIISQREPGERVDYNQREKEIEDCFGEINDEWVDEWYEFMDSLVLQESVLPRELDEP